MRFVLLPFLLAIGYVIGSGSPFASAASFEKLTVQSTDFASGGLIPKRFSGDGQDISPALTWSKVPAATQSIAVTCTDSDAPRGTWWHWILFNLPATSVDLKSGQPKSGSLAGGAGQGTNDFGNVGYNGPAPPNGPIHHYHFAVYALDAKLALNPGCSKQELTAAMQGHTIAGGEYIGTFVRR